MPGGTTIAPAGADPLTLVTTRTTNIGSGQTLQEQYTGPVTELETKEAALLAAWPLTRLSTLTLQHSNGRGTLTAAYERIAAGISPEDEAFQELYGMDLVRDIVLAPYWKEKGLTNDDIVKIRYVAESRLVSTDPKYIKLTTGWGQYHNELYQHLINGQDSYIETVYEFRETYRVTSARNLRKASANPNTVQSLPSLGRTLKTLIDSLPDGEWLKKPTVVTSAGKGFWEVRTCYHYAKTWSVIYGGTFTGA